MGHRRLSAPRHGSLRYMPRKRSVNIKGRIRNWLDIEGEPQFLGFAGFKAGMTHIAFIEDQETSPFFGKELMKAVTVVETPPMVMFGIKIYQRDEYGLHCKGEILANKLEKQLARKINLPNSDKYDYKKKLKEIKKKVVEKTEVRGLFHTLPKKASIPRIKPDIVEIKISGGANGEERFEFALKSLGKQIRIMDCFDEGELIDVVGITKGKGFQGPVKRFGIKLLPRKTRGTKRGVGCIGPWHPARVMYTVARSGQMGYHQRVEYHKRIMKMSENGEEINPKGGFLKYGLIKGDYIILLGSIPGPKKRLIRLRKTIRPKKRFEVKSPEITYINRQSHQKK
ncbi:MAG: 50S ribosomal protein L3 [Candidatus Lokiarchaeota archaeon]|nr:50S ribosomal protein L3 [Candidatus Lokiarchaeota archaeon]